MQSFSNLWVLLNQESKMPRNYDDRDYTDYENSPQRARNRKAQKELLALLMEGYRTAEAAGGIGDQEMDRARNERNQAIGTTAGTLAFGSTLGGPAGAIAGPQDQPL